jgi:two-component system nitrate/nitrite response regulator NarL
MAKTSTPKEHRTRVFVADDHPVFREALAAAIEDREDMELAGSASGGEEALQAIRVLGPEVALLDIRMPGLDGLAILTALTANDLPTKVLFLSAYFEPATVFEAVRAGAGGYLSKDFKVDAICDAIATVARGGTVLCPQAQGAISKHVRGQPATREASLTPRECEVLSLAAAGNSSSAIAERLYLSPATVKTHLQRIYEKLGASDRAAAVAEGMRRGLID